MADVACDLTKQQGLWEQPDFAKAPKGKVTGSDASLETVRRINVITAKSAENLILTGGESEYAQLLATTYAKYRVEHESQMARQGKAYLISARSRVKGPTMGALYFDVSTGLQLATQDPDSAQCLWATHWDVIVRTGDRETVLFGRKA